MNFCKDCKHYKFVGGGLMPPPWDYCTFDPEPVLGRPTPCDIVRGRDGRCGPLGEYWERRPEQVPTEKPARKWWRIWEAA